MKRCIRYSIIIISILLMTFANLRNASAQSYNILTNNNYQIEARVHYGMLYPHHLELERYRSHFPSFELSVLRNTFGKNRWEFLYNSPLLGVTFFYSGLGGNSAPFDELGHVFALYPYINFPLNNDKDSQLTFKLGVGLAYLTKKYHNTDNYHNYAIGSHVNAAANLSFEYRQHITKRLSAVASLGLTHFSNGSTKTPNFGINIVSAALGFSFFLKEPNPQLVNRLKPELYLFEFDYRKYFYIDVALSGGYKDMTTEFGGHSFFAVINFAGNILYPINEKGRAGISFELVQDFSDKAYLISRGDWTPKYPNLDILRPGLGMTYEMVMDRMSFVFNIGWQLAGADQHEGSFYQKLSVRYDFYENWFATFGLTTHYAKADFLGLGIGHRFKIKYYTQKKYGKPRK